ncbi:uncharacterized protein EV420DRAFT_1277775 [Desarmillaria tabescens]|uniref:Heterokaryon incompatibility domain-containing protein n=1 Tax=Armillaria tabescens TaxID=1929756 RepID=A0AA39JLF4_ARMTA|nr:uncharacterized protein EV420DRAFT_1277775 [Desarmillaria tabescens]KAK0443906.1 hypothetical protein EV420DRAFT_1277775 [Desarmillaria tabescens]
MQDELRRCEEKDQETRRDALVGNQIVNPQLPPRRVWDLYSNRVMPYWIAGRLPESISHAWMDEKDRIDVWTPINGKEWPVPIPKDADLNLIRIEMLNLGLEYAWLDVLCLRQVGGLREDLRMEEWELDVPTIGNVYLNRRWKPVMIYLSGLGRPLSLKDGDMDSERSWFRRAWTVQEIGEQRIIAGDTPDGPMHAKPINKDGNYETAILTRFHMQWESFKRLNRGIFSTLADMQKRVSTNPVDRIAGLAFPLSPNTIPVYHESEPLEDAWTALVNTMSPWIRVGFLFLYPEAGRVGSKKWRPAWEQVMTEPLPVDAPWLGTVRRNDEKDEDWYEGYCIEKGLVCGFNVGLAAGGDRHGKLVVKDADGREHIFKIIAAHQYPIPEDSYTLLGNDQRASKYWAVGRRLPEQRFEKVSIFALNDSKEADRLVDLGIRSRNILV